MKINFIYSQHYDLIFHIMAYFKVNNASDLYDKDYIVKMAKKKAEFAYDIIPVVNSLQKYYNENFERLMLINFLPYYCNDYNEMKKVFLTSNYFTQDDIKFFINPFIEMLDKESVFFFEYWKEVNEKCSLSSSITENYFQKKLEEYSRIFNYFGKSCKILFSYNITRNGRGFYDDSYFAALIRFPKNEAEFNFSFIQLLHEYTHSFTDGLLNKNINMKDGSHNISEYLVIIADYYLIKFIDKNFIPIYFDWIKNVCNEAVDEAKFLNVFNIDENLNSELMKLINNILDSHT